MFQKLFFSFVFFCFSWPAWADHFEDSLERCADIRSEIEAILEEEGVSRDFYYLALAESGCHLNASSKGGAAGLWQLTKWTARRYGLRVDSQLDERFDWRLATHAAAKYLAHLQKMFHEFKWTVAAYNTGGSNLKRKTKYKPKMSFDIVKTVAKPVWALAMTVDRWRKLGKKRDALVKES